MLAAAIKQVEVPDLIGDDVTIGAGTKVINRARLGNRVRTGPNCVVDASHHPGAGLVHVPPAGLLTSSLELLTIRLRVRTPLDGRLVLAVLLDPHPGQAVEAGDLHVTAAGQIDDPLGSVNAAPERIVAVNDSAAFQIASGIARRLREQRDPTYWQARVFDVAVRERISDRIRYAGHALQRLKRPLK